MIVLRGVARGERWERSSPETRKICKGWRTTNAKASNEPNNTHSLDSRRIFVNQLILLKKF